MTTSKPRVRRNRSLVEYLANRGTIESLLEQGYNVLWIYDELHEKGLVTVSYAAFRKTLIKMRPQNQHKPGLAPAANAKPSSPPIPQGDSVSPAPRSGPQVIALGSVKNKYDPKTYANHDDLIGPK